MTLDEELERLTSFHPESPQYKYYYGLLDKKLGLDLYEGSVNIIEYNKARKIMESSLLGGNFKTTVWLKKILDQYCSKSLKVFQDLLYRNNLKLTRDYSKKLYQVIKGAKTGIITDETFVRFVLEDLKKLNACIDDEDRKVYELINKLDICFTVALHSRVMDKKFRRCFEIFTALKLKVYKDDKEFYDEYFESINKGQNYAIDRERMKDGIQRGEVRASEFDQNRMFTKRVVSTVKASNVFNPSEDKTLKGKNITDTSEYYNSLEQETNLNVDDYLEEIRESNKQKYGFEIESYYDLLCAIANFFYECSGPSEERVYSSRNIYDAILDSTLSDDTKTHLTSIFTSQCVRVRASSESFKDVFYNYSIYRDDCIFMSSHSSLLKACEVCEFIVKSCSLDCIVGYCVSKCEQEYFCTKSVESRNALLYNLLNFFGESGMITDVVKLYNKILDEYEWRESSE